MKRLKRVFVIGVMALAACMIVAGPAVAAKGGNSDNAHACQQGGHESLFEAESGNPFKNAGDCVSHGAQGGASSSLQFLTVPTYPCRRGTGTCWGFVSGSNLAPRTIWAVIDSNGIPVFTGRTGVDGSLPSTAVDLRCGTGGFELQAVTQGGPVVIDRNAPC
jgi:hypothetical protein